MFTLKFLTRRLRLASSGLHAQLVFRHPEGILRSSGDRGGLYGFGRTPSVREHQRQSFPWGPARRFGISRIQPIFLGGEFYFVRIEFDLSGAIDIAAERGRLEKELAAAEKERAVNAGKLGNESFTAKAPETVVAKVRGRLSAAEADIERIRAALTALPSA